MENGKIVKVAIIGQGRSGRGIHSGTLHKMPDKFQIAAVVDGEESRRIRAIEELGCAAYSTHEELYARNDLDLIVNATPSHMHVPLSLEFLQRGFNVLCEKPLATTAAQARAMYERAEATGVKHMSFFALRNSLHHRYVR